MRFTQKFIKNKVYVSQALSFNNLAEVVTEKGKVHAGAFMQENGDILFRLHLPSAEKVSIQVSVSRKVSAEVQLEKRSNECFEGILPYREEMTGPANVAVYVDGVQTLLPELPIIWAGNRPANNIEIPDPEDDYLHIQDVSHGALTREIFWSKATENWERCMVYTPAGYQKSKESYPVLYLQHGGGDNEMMWEYVGRVSQIMDNLIAKGEAVPFLIVMCNAMLRESGTVGFPIDKTFEKLLIGDCIPFIEENYRVKTGKWNRAVAGLSMGSFMTSDLAFGNPDVFGSLGNFTAGMTCGDLQTTYERPWKAFMEKGAKYFASQFKLYFRSTTPQEDHLEYFEGDDDICARAGIDQLPCYHRNLYPPRTSKWNSWRMGLRDFAKLVFRDE